MTKKIILLFLLMAGYLFHASAVQAILISGTVNPNTDGIYDLQTSLSGTAVYSFEIGISDYEITGVSLEFEKDVFDFGNGNSSINESTLPAGWVSATIIDNSSYRQEFIYTTNGTGIPEGDTLTFSVDFTLLGPAPTLDWREGGPWNQGYGVSLTPDIINPLGGSTSLISAVIPEPATIFLVGTGLLAFGISTRKSR